jgi:exosome complex RNA-binding protein Rrp4
MKFEIGKVYSNPYATAFKSQKMIEGDIDHEVKMAQGQLDYIINVANELKGKLGNAEKNIPAWIQDHISKAHSYLHQSNSGYHEYKKDTMSESKISQSQLKPIYDKLSKGDVVEITYDSSMSRGITKRFKVIKGKTTVGKLGVERITLVNVDKPTSVKYYLYNRNNMITFAHGDMGASIVNIQKENINEDKLQFKNLKKGDILVGKFPPYKEMEVISLTDKSAKVKSSKGEVVDIYSTNNYELKENSMKLSKLLKENTEPQIITQLRDVMKSGYKTLKDPKSGRKMKVDSYSASAIVKVYDALKDPKNKEKFSSMGLLGMQSTAFKFVK